MKNLSRQSNNTWSLILKSLKLGFNHLLLPPKVENFHNNPFTRIFRVLGGITIILFVFFLYFYGIKPFINLTIFTLAMLHFLYIIIISLIKLWYLAYMWKNKKLELRNSLLDQVASLALKLAALPQTACVAVGTSATATVLGFGVDKLLEVSGNLPRKR